jgi:hypothetical protein
MRKLVRNALIVSLLSPPAAFADDALDCKADVGDDASAIYVQECLSVLPANAAKCNVANPCSQIRLEIQRACAAVIGSNPPDTPKPDACVKYSEPQQQPASR